MYSGVPFSFSPSKPDRNGQGLDEDWDRKRKGNSNFLRIIVPKIFLYATSYKSSGLDISVFMYLVFFIQFLHSKP